VLRGRDLMQHRRTSRLEELAKKVKDAKLQPLTCSYCGEVLDRSEAWKPPDSGFVCSDCYAKHIGDLGIGEGSVEYGSHADDD